MKFNPNDSRAKLPRIGKIMGIKDIYKEIAEWYNGGMSTTEIAEIINRGCRPYMSITGKAIEDYLKYLGLIRSKSEARKVAIKSGRMIYKRKNVEDAIKRVAIPLKIRYKILAKSGFRCAACGERDFLEVDHIVAVKNGGSNDESNLQVLCWRCNKGKADNE